MGGFEGVKGGLAERMRQMLPRPVVATPQLTLLKGVRQCTADVTRQRGGTGPEVGEKGEG